MTSFVLPPRFVNQTVRIHLVGAGGTGSQMADQLASLEVTLRKLGHPGFQVAVIDPDYVSDSNIGRQRFAAADVGLAKASIIVHRINAFYGLSWRAAPDAYELDEHHWPDLLITAVDKATVRAQIGEAALEQPSSSLWLDMGNGPTSGNVVLGHLGTPRDGQRLPNVYDLYPELAGMSAHDEEAPSCSTEEAIRRQEWPVNRMAAMLGSELLWTLFRHGRIEHHGAFFSLAPTRVTPLPIDTETWRFMGYNEETRTTQEPTMP
jgi:PRTRC genetic system ThiF family protein